MKRVLLFYICLSASLAVFAQENIIEKVWSTSESADGLQTMDTRIGKLVTNIEKRHHKNDQSKLYTIFKKTHSNFLSQYVQYSDINDLAKGKYDCLTATSLFAEILSRTGFNYKIIETNYHIFIVVNTLEGNVLLETTDRVGGFINDEKQFKARLGEYQKNILQAATSSHYKYSFSLFKAVDADQLAGLLYFNQAVKAFNNENWEECSEKLSAAAQTTNSPRIAELTELLNQTANR